MKETLPKHESLSPRTREASTHSLASSTVYLLGLSGLAGAKGNHDQLKEGAIGVEESDPKILVRDGKTDHTAKMRTSATAYVILGGCSDDSFSDFRATLICYT